MRVLGQRDFFLSFFLSFGLSETKELKFLGETDCLLRRLKSCHPLQADIRWDEFKKLPKRSATRSAI